MELQLRKFAMTKNIEKVCEQQLSLKTVNSIVVSYKCLMHWQNVEVAITQLSMKLQL